MTDNTRTIEELEAAFLRLVTAGYTRPAAQGIMRKLGEAGKLKSKCTFEEAIAEAIKSLRGEGSE